MNVIKGLDLNAELTRHAVSLKAQGFHFTMRYYSHSAAKNLSVAEAHALSDAGMRIGVVWESAGNHVAHFNAMRGLADGAAALHAAHELRQPVGSTIYFGVDCDPDMDQIETHVIPYFNGVRQARAAANANGVLFKVGVYGSGLCCKAVIASGLATQSWLAQSTGWRGYHEYHDGQHYNILQLAGETVVVDDGRHLKIDADVTSDLDRAGLWTLA